MIDHPILTGLVIGGVSGFIGSLITISHSEVTGAFLHFPFHSANVAGDPIVFTDEDLPTRCWTLLSGAALKRIWDNEIDAIYDEL